MHSHDAHFVAAVFHVALYFAIPGAKVCKEARQRWRRVIIIVEGEIEKLVDGVGGFRPKPMQHFCAGTVAI